MSWRRGQAYAQDLRERVLAAVDGGMPVYPAAPVYRVSVSYIYKALAQRRQSGALAADVRICRATGGLPDAAENVRAAVGGGGRAPRFKPSPHGTARSR